MKHNPHQSDFDLAFDSLLDEALAPPKAPESLSDRIIARTQDRLASPVIVGRIGPSPLRWTVAAGALVAACIALVVSLLPDGANTPPSNHTAGTGDVVAADPVSDLEWALAAFDTDARLNTSLDRDMEMLRFDIELAMVSFEPEMNISDPWESDWPEADPWASDWF